jgi:hypothetical protein
MPVAPSTTQHWPGTNEEATWSAAEAPQAPRGCRQPRLDLASPHPKGQRWLIQAHTIPPIAHSAVTRPQAGAQAAACPVPAGRQSFRSNVSSQDHPSTTKNFFPDLSGPDRTFLSTTSARKEQPTAWQATTRTAEEGEEEPCSACSALRPHCSASAGRMCSCPGVGALQPAAGGMHCRAAGASPQSNGLADDFPSTCASAPRHTRAASLQLL